MIPFHVNNGGGSNDTGRKAETTECLPGGATCRQMRQGRQGEFGGSMGSGGSATDH